jgi:hypothetical protein
MLKRDQGNISVQVAALRTQTAQTSIVIAFYLQSLVPIYYHPKLN